MNDRPIKVLLAKKRIDVHGRGSKLIARELRDAGMEVVYFRFGVVDEIVNAAIEEDVDVVAVSIMTSGHLHVAEQLVQKLKEKGVTDVMVIFGGIIPDVDFDAMESLGVHRSFPAGLPGTVVASYIKENVGKCRPRLRRDRNVNYQTIILEIADHTATITFNRPEVFNAYSEQMSHELCDAVAAVAADPSVRVLFLKGAGENFLAGADINMLNSWAEIAREKGSGEVKRILGQHFSPTLLEELPIPVIALVDGRAWGMGGEVALGADIRICTDRASFAQPEISLGLITGGGASQRLPRVVGQAKAMEMILTGMPIDAAEAYRCGLVSRVVAPDQLDAAGAQLAKQIASKSPLMTKWAKECVNLTRDHDLLTGIDKELTRFSETFLTNDAREGTAAFLEKRRARFTGT